MVGPTTTTTTPTAAAAATTTTTSTTMIILKTAPTLLPLAFQAPRTKAKLSDDQHVVVFLLWTQWEGRGR